MNKKIINAHSMTEHVDAVSMEKKFIVVFVVGGGDGKRKIIVWQNIERE